MRSGCSGRLFRWAGFVKQGGHYDIKQFVEDQRIREGGGASLGEGGTGLSTVPVSVGGGWWGAQQKERIIYQMKTDRDSEKWEEGGGNKQ